MLSKKSISDYIKAHDDYIRTTKFDNNNLILSGGYDKFN